MTDSKHSADALLDAEPMTDQEFPNTEGSDTPEPQEASDQEPSQQEIEASAAEESVAQVGSPEEVEAGASDPEGSADKEGSSDEGGSSDQEGSCNEEGSEESKIGPGEALSDDELVQAISALVFASPEPLATGRLVTLLERPKPQRVAEALIEIQGRLEQAGLPLQMREIAGGWRLMTAPEQNESVARLVKTRKNEKLSPAGLETLAVVAYRQPVTKADIEAIRGVQCGPMLRNLVDRGLAKVVGRADVPGGPLEYGTTKEFLDRFGMASLKDLPRDGELLKE